MSCQTSVLNLDSSTFSPYVFLTSIFSLRFTIEFLCKGFSVLVKSGMLRKLCDERMD